MTFQDFAYEMRLMESSNNYQCINDWGFLGSYQMGKPRLWDLDISIDGWQPSFAKRVAKKIKGFILYGNVKKQILTTEQFLNNPDIQDALFELHVDDHYRTIKRKFSKYIDTFTMSGLIAGAHLKGIGGLKQFLKHGRDTADGLGTHIFEYIIQFRGYDLTTKDVKVNG